MDKVAEAEKADAELRDVMDLILAANLLRAVAFRRDSMALHALASSTGRFVMATFEQTGEVQP